MVQVEWVAVHVVAGGEVVERLNHAVTPNALQAYARDAETGALTQNDAEIALSSAETLAITADDAHLFVFDNNGTRANLFSLEDPDNPASLDDLSAFWQTSFLSQLYNVCSFASIRREALVADVFCADSAYVAEWRSNVKALAGTDYISHTQPDRNNHPIPEFAFPQGMAASPDGVHVYITTPQHGVLIFERIGVDAEPAAE